VAGLNPNATFDLPEAGGVARLCWQRAVRLCRSPRGERGSGSTGTSASFTRGRWGGDSPRLRFNASGGDTTRDAARRVGVAAGRLERVRRGRDGLVDGQSGVHVLGRDRGDSVGHSPVAGQCLSAEAQRQRVEAHWESPTKGSPTFKGYAYWTQVKHGAPPTMMSSNPPQGPVRVRFGRPP